MTRRTRVLLVDDHPVVLQGTLRLLRSASDFEPIGEATSAADALALAAERRPELAIVDLRLGQDLAPDLCRRLRATLPECRIVVFTAYDDRGLLAACMVEGATGVILKDAHEFDVIGALRRVRAGRVVIDPRLASLRNGGQRTTGEDPLTRREYEVLRLLSVGRSTAEIAAELHLSINTVRSYVRDLLMKLDARSRVQAVATARQRRLI